MLGPGGQRSNFYVAFSKVCSVLTDLWISEPPEIIASQDGRGPRKYID